MKGAACDAGAAGCQPLLWGNCCAVNKKLNCCFRLCHAISFCATLSHTLAKKNKNKQKRKRQHWSVTTTIASSCWFLPPSDTQQGFFSLSSWVETINSNRWWLSRSCCSLPCCLGPVSPAGVASAIPRPWQPPGPEPNTPPGCCCRPRLSQLRWGCSLASTGWRAAEPGVRPSGPPARRIVWWRPPALLKGQRGKWENKHSSFCHRLYAEIYTIWIHFFFFLQAWWVRLRCVNTLLSLTDSDLTFILILSVCLFKGEINTQFCPHFLQSYFVVLRRVSPGIQLPLTYALLGSLALICAA